jgi:dTDP-glucose 4,6-dehydratase
MDRQLDQNTRTILVTGGAGFIGSCFVRRLAERENVLTINLDKLTYAGNLDSIAMVPETKSKFVQGDICDEGLVRELLNQHRPQSIVHFAAQSHVDRSIDSPMDFVVNNVLGTCTLLEATRHYWRRLPTSEAESFRFVHISTDEVFGSLLTGSFSEESPYQPRSPYAASKASSDHFVRAAHETYGLPTLITNCSNNYGPYQFPEKLIPLMTLNAIEGKPLPVYGDGLNVRDWLYVEDHCEAIELVLNRGVVGQTYNIGGNCELTNLALVHSVCDIVQECLPELPHRCSDLVTFVPDRPGHDRRYAMNTHKINTQLGWQPRTSFDLGLRQTIRWIIDNPEWIRRVIARGYNRERLGLGAIDHA